MSLKSLLKSSVTAVALVALASAANAQIITQTASIGLTLTNWTNSTFVPTLNKFDSSLGTLTSVVLKLKGDVSANFRVESLDAGPTTVALNSIADISLLDAPNGPALLSVQATGGLKVDLEAFDGLIDFAGTSGTVVNNVTGTKSDSITYVGGAVNPFIGSGTFSYYGTATGSSNGSGSGNLLTQIQTKAGAELELVYNYTPTSTVPEPGAFAMIGASLLATGFVAVRRRK